MKINLAGNDLGLLRMIVCDLSTSSLLETYEKNVCLASLSVVSPLCSPTPSPRTNSSGFKENLGLEPRPSYGIMYLDLTFNLSGLSLCTTHC